MSTVVSTIGVADPRPFPDVILRSQFFEMVGTRSLSSEQRLMLAVLADAINVVQEFGGSSSLRKRNSFNEAWNWFFTKGGSCPLSYDSVCDALGIDAQGLRWRLSELVAGRGGSSAPPAPEGSEPDAAPDRKSSAPPRPAPSASRKSHPLASRHCNRV